MTQPKPRDWDLRATTARGRPTGRAPHGQGRYSPLVIAVADASDGTVDVKLVDSTLTATGDTIKAISIPE